MSRTYTQRPNKQLKVLPWMSWKFVNEERRTELTRLGFLKQDRTRVVNYAAAVELKNYLSRSEWWNTVGYMLADKAPQEHQFGSIARYDRAASNRRLRSRSKLALKKNEHNGFEDYHDGSFHEHGDNRYFS